MRTSSEAPTDERSRGLLVRFVVIAGVAVAFVLWWAWPWLSDADEQVDVLVVADEFLGGVERSIDLELRGDGRSVEWLPAADGWCTSPAEVEQVLGMADPAQVVVSGAAAADECVAELLPVLASHDVVAVVVPGRGPSADDLVAGGLDHADVLDPRRLVGAPDGDRVMPCMWWDVDRCRDGVVEVRTDDGALTEAGGSRVARLVLAALSRP